MVINWTKIIILIVVIGAFTGIILGIVIAFRTQCPDGKIYNKTCKKCVTKCDDGYNLPTKDGSIDCDSETCVIDCKDQCNLNDSTCGEKCGQECCGNKESCGYDYECKKNNCPQDSPQFYCDETIGQICTATPGSQAFCRDGAQKCDKTYTNKCPNNQEFCCTGDNVCLESDSGSLFCCDKEDGVSKTGCCPKNKITDDGKCCPSDEEPNGSKCCPLGGSCGDNCCDEDEKCVGGKCLPSCPGTSGGYCETGEFCMDGNKCVKDPCEWGQFNYNPDSIDNKKICIPGKLDDKKANCIANSDTNLEGVWARDFRYRGLSGEEACREATIVSNIPSKCSEIFCEKKIEQEGLIMAGWDPSTGTCKGTIDCTNPNPDNDGKIYLPTVSTPGAKPEGCSDSGVCCDRESFLCGDVCVPRKIDDNTVYCLVDDDGQLCGKYFNSDKYGKDDTLIKGVAGTAQDWCDNKCQEGWAVNENHFCNVESCSNVPCSFAALVSSATGIGIQNNCAIGADGKVDPLLKKCCTTGKTGDHAAGGWNLSEAKCNGSGWKDGDVPNTATTCDQWCRGKGLGSGTIHGEVTAWWNACANGHTCSYWDRTMAIPNDDATEFINFDQADCMEAGTMNSDYTLKSHAWLDFDVPCTSGYKTCVCEKKAG